MSRVPASRHDAKAVRLLNAAASLIDAALSPSLDDQPPRLRSIRFPAALDWMRVEDVLRVAGHDGPISKKAFVNRWPTREEFLRDALVHAMLYRDGPEDVLPRHDPPRVLERGLRSRLVADATLIANEVFDDLVCHPRSFVLAHLAPTLHHYPEIRERVLSGGQLSQQNWAQMYVCALEANNLSLRPGWNIESLTLALQCLLDGYVLRSRLDDRVAHTHWESASPFADAVIAVLCGAIDLDGSAATTADWLTTQVLAAPKDTHVAP